MTASESAARNAGAPSSLKSVASEILLIIYCSCPFHAPSGDNTIFRSALPRELRPLHVTPLRDLLDALLEVGLAAPAGFVVVGGCVDRENPAGPAPQSSSVMTETLRVHTP